MKNLFNKERRISKKFANAYEQMEVTLKKGGYDLLMKQEGNSILLQITKIPEIEFLTK